MRAMSALKFELIAEIPAKLSRACWASSVAASSVSGSPVVTALPSVSRTFCISTKVEAESCNAGNCTSLACSRASVLFNAV